MVAVDLVDNHPFLVGHDDGPSGLHRVAAEANCIVERLRVAARRCNVVEPQPLRFSGRVAAIDLKVSTSA
jgi:hypothetical protein